MSTDDSASTERGPRTKAALILLASAGLGVFGLYSTYDGYITGRISTPDGDTYTRQADLVSFYQWLTTYALAGVALLGTTLAGFFRLFSKRGAIYAKELTAQADTPMSKPALVALAVAAAAAKAVIAYIAVKQRAL